MRVRTQTGRIIVREELTGLTHDELPRFLDHHFTAEHTKRLCQEGIHTLFERGPGIPALIAPMFRRLPVDIESNEPIDPFSIDNILRRLELA